MNPSQAGSTQVNSNPFQFRSAALAAVTAAVSLVQSAILGMFVVAGSVAGWVPIAFLIISTGVSAAFLAYCAGGDRALRGRQATFPLLAVMAVVQMAFLVLEPKMALVFLLGLMSLCAIGLGRMSPLQAQWGWMVFGAMSGIGIVMARHRFGFPGTSPLELALLWLMFMLALRALISGSSELAAMRRIMAAKDAELETLGVRLEKLVRHDSLTGAFNRRGLLELLENELLRSRRTGHPFCFAAVDLDHFKQVNEKYGHAAGDAVLRSFSDMSMRLLRALDRFGRLDSEEFGIIMPATWLDQGGIAMNRLTKALSDHNWKDVAPGLTLTFSAGLTTNTPNDTAESLIERAEKALRQAKEEGRHRVVSLEEDLPPMPAADPN
jgi:diguanylate cyclase (GGDEF)-like protein